MKDHRLIRGKNSLMTLGIETGLGLKDLRE